MGLSPSQHKSLIRGYGNIRTKNELKVQKRTLEIYENIPQYKVIDKKIADIGIDFSKLIFLSPEKRSNLLKNLKQEIIELKEKKLRLLDANGYKRDYLDPIFNCAFCKDTGYIDDRQCTCLRKAIIDISYKQSNLNDILKIENFDTFSIDFYSREIDKKYGISPYENIQSVYNECLQFSENFDMAYSNIILYGQSGLGKTFLCNCIAKALLDKSYSVIYLTAFQLFRIYETYRFKNKEGIISYEDIEDLFTCDLLIIDDLGSEIINSFTSSELFNLLNTRLLNKKSIVISTNFTPPEWSIHYSNRIVSRIFGNYKPLILIGEDIRMQKYS